MKQNKNGFTLIELMVVVGLIAILLAMVLINLNKNRIRARDNIRVAHIQTIRLALEEYRAVCGVFPATLELDTNNTRTSLQQSSSNGCEFELGDFIPEIPTAPALADGSQILADGVARNENVFGGYYYAGLSTQVNGPCFEYHIAAELEFKAENGIVSSQYLSKDHDFIPDDGVFNHSCSNSPQDFGDDAEDDDALGLYNFRSTNTGSL
jgi:prepilin-type N-terminal cleavage/methylation domain-containing protein